MDIQDIPEDLTVRISQADERVLNSLNKKSGTHGGTRPNSGPKRGAIYKPTREKLEAAHALRHYLEQHMAPLGEALVDAARGVQHMMAREKDGKWTEVTDPKVMAKVLNSGESFYKLSARKPDVNALRECFDRLLGKPQQGVDLNITGPEIPKQSDAELLARAKALVTALHG